MIHCCLIVNTTKICYQVFCGWSINIPSATSAKCCWLFSHKEKQFFTLHLSRLLLKLLHEEQVAKTDCRIRACWERVSVTLSGTRTFDLSKQASLSTAIVLIDEVNLIGCHLPTLIWFPNPIKWRQEEQSPYSFGFTSESLHPKPEEMGKWSFQLILMGSPGPLGLKGTTELWRAQQQRMLFRCSKMPRDWVYRRESAHSNSQREPFALHSTSFRDSFLTRGQTNRTDFKSIFNQLLTWSTCTFMFVSEKKKKSKTKTEGFP